MKIDQLTSQSLKAAVDLLEEKEAYQSKLAEIEEELTALLGGESSVEKAAETVQKNALPQSARRVKTGRQGQSKEAITALLKKAGDRGISLKDICQKLGMSQSRINSWMHATGKKLKEIKKLGRGVYAWIE